MPKGRCNARWYLRVFPDCGTFVGDGYHQLLPVIICQRTPQLIPSIISNGYVKRLSSEGRAHRFKSCRARQFLKGVFRSHGLHLIPET